MPFVLDASVAVSWAFDDEDHSNAALALERIRKDEAHVPSLWWYEVRNSVIVNERGHRLTEADTAVFLRALSRLDVAVDQSPDEARILAITRRHRLTSTTPSIWSWRRGRRFLWPRSIPSSRAQPAPRTCDP